MIPPLSTYRIQFHQKFNFEKFEKHIAYLHQLGVDAIYASPIFKAVPGSQHGYDVTDPHQINPEIGSLEQLLKISAKLKKLGMKWIQDIVPNHMAFHQDNWRLMDVLKNGSSSAYAHYFDTSLSSDFMQGKLRLPVLGADLKECIQNGEIKVTKREQDLFIQYYDQLFPISDAAVKSFHLNDDDLFIDNKLLNDILGQQHYELVSWWSSDSQMNYRRFFTVNGLICLNAHDQKVFEDYHQLIFRLLEEGVFDGVRIDHIDGLYDPSGYLEQLKANIGDKFIVVEKILEDKEQTPRWPVAGTTGYDFLAQVNNLLTAKSNRKAFLKFYRKFSVSKENVKEEQLNKKRYILAHHMQGELKNLTTYFIQSALWPSADESNVKEAISAFLTHFDVYRFYFSGFPLEEDSFDALQDILKELEEAGNDNIAILLNVINKSQRTKDTKYQEKASVFFQRCMQFTGPLMAKGVEDTLMYTFNAFVGHNEVGDHPSRFGMKVSDFHELMKERAKHWPHAQNATSTHDTKRGEDVRCRLNVLSHHPQMWFDAVNRWEKMTLQKKAANPEANTRYFIYQNLLGTYPFSDHEKESFKERFKEYLIKALREGKTYSDWNKSNEEYEQKTLAWINSLLNEDAPFYQDFIYFLSEIADEAILFSLSQQVLKFTCPGIPDVYQGTELWDFSMVDPDNRRPVDYELRKTLLNQKNTSLKDLWPSRYGGALKLQLTHLLFRLRQNESHFFTDGAYHQIKVKGEYKQNVIAFERRYKDEHLLVIAPIASPSHDTNNKLDVDWKDTALVWDFSVNYQFKNLLLEDADWQSHEVLNLNSILKDFPIAVFKAVKKNPERKSGILLHISSLPSATHIGDLGPQARRFIDFLSSARQSYWQILPLNPISKDQFYSPYSSESTMAANTLFISPERLVEEGLLKKDFLSSKQAGRSNRVDYDSEVILKTEILEEAWINRKDNDIEFDAFCKREEHWLNDYACFKEIKSQQKGAAWYKWPQKLRERDAASLEEFQQKHQKSIEKHKWFQFLVDKQWQQLKQYAHGGNGVSIIGDLPFYVGYDSAEVWANPHLFSLTKNKEMKEMAGVPPDYFNSEGQLWGMPVYDWPNHEKDHFDWWVKRIARNLQFYDIIRLDHFRAFADYWSVPKGESTAVNGQWKSSPGKAFFEALKTHFPDLPFIAEDLGDINQDVYDLRDGFQLPGMRVLQFGFGSNLPVSNDIPHQYTRNSIVYTGTHDNNTTLGWFRNDADAMVRENLSAYLGGKINEKNICNSLIKAAYASVSQTAIIPLQDFLKLDETARMNTPATTEDNWQWRLKEDELDKKLAKKIRKLVGLYNR